MLKKLKICCGCGSKDSVVVPEHSAVGKSPALSEKSYVNELQMRESGMMDPMSNVSYETINPAYMSAQTAPQFNPSDYPINQRKNSEDDSGMSEPRDVQVQCNLSAR